jgi:hypothetical protein
MAVSENDSLSRSVEHFIPNVLLTRRRGKGDGDFYACRTCNSTKSDMDYVLGVLSKSQCEDEDIIVDTMWKALDDTKRNTRFIDMILSGCELRDGKVVMKLPVSGREVAEYSDYLAKGQYFKRHKKPMNPNEFIVTFSIVGNNVMSNLRERYRSQHRTDPFEDLKKNKYTEVIGDGECLIWSKNERTLFAFYGGSAIITELKRYSNKNIERRKTCILEVDEKNT